VTRPKVTRTVQIMDGAWYQQHDYTRDICCDCCMVHDMDYKVENGVIWFRATVNQRETNKLRKKHGIKVAKDAG
jgi:hypothetical protein